MDPTQNFVYPNNPNNQVFPLPNQMAVNYNPMFPQSFLQSGPSGSLVGRVQVPQGQETDTLDSLLNALQKFRSNSHQAKHQEVVLTIGSTGAGKSTFLNYMLGRKNFRHEKNSEINLSVSCDDPIFGIGHGKSSATSISEVHFDERSGLALCDCPGFFDNRTYTQQVINALSIRSIAKESKLVKAIVLCIEWSSIQSMRGRDLDQTIQLTLQFLGVSDWNSVFVMFTKAFDCMSPISNPQKALEEVSLGSYFLTQLRQINNIGFYNPLNENHASQPYVYTRESMIQKIKQFQGISNKPGTFNISISNEACAHIGSLIDTAQENIVSFFKSGLNSKEDLSEMATIVESVFQLKELLDTPKVRERLRALDDAMKAQIQILGNRNEMREGLEELLGILPESFHSIINEVIDQIDSRVAKEKEQKQLMEKNQQEIVSCQDKIQEIQKEKIVLENHLKEQKISLQEYQEKLQIQQKKAEQHEQEQRKFMEEIERLKKQQAEEKEKREKLESENKTRVNKYSEVISLSDIAKILNSSNRHSDNVFPLPNQCNPNPMNWQQPFYPQFAQQDQPHLFHPSPNQSTLNAGNRSLGSRTITVQPYTRRDGTRVSGYTYTGKR